MLIQPKFRAENDAPVSVLNGVYSVLISIAGMLFTLLYSSIQVHIELTFKKLWVSA